MSGVHHHAPLDVVSLFVEQRGEALELGEAVNHNDRVVAHVGAFAEEVGDAEVGREGQILVIGLDALVPGVERAGE